MEGILKGLQSIDSKQIHINSRGLVPVNLKNTRPGQNSEELFLKIIGIFLAGAKSAALYIGWSQARHVGGTEKLNGLLMV